MKQLVEIKSFFEKRVNELEKEASMLRSLLEIADKVLAEKSFRKVEISKEPEKNKKTKTYEETILIKTADGTLLAEIHLDDNRLKVIPSSNINFDVNSPPFKSFLINRILEQMHVKDIDLTKKGKMNVDKIFDYKIDQLDDYLKEINIENYGDERRLFELRNAIRWTFRRMHEKITGSSNQT